MSAKINFVSRSRFCRCLIPAYATTIRTSTNGIAAAAERDTKRAATDEAAPTKHPPHMVTRKTILIYDLKGRTASPTKQYKHNETGEDNADACLKVMGREVVAHEFKTISKISRSYKTKKYRMYNKTRTNRLLFFL